MNKRLLQHILKHTIETETQPLNYKLFGFDRVRFVWTAVLVCGAASLLFILLPN